MSRMRRIWGSAAVVLLALVPLFPTTTTSDTKRQLVALGRDSCRPVGARTASPVGAGSCSGVRPGGWFTSPTAGCSFNFMFKGSDGYRYIGTAGHCLVADGREAKWGPGKGPVISSGGRAVGRGAYAILKGDRDFALIRLDRGVKANPQMCHFGGPTGIDTVRSSGPVVLEHYGNGVAVSTLTPARTSLALNTRDPDVVTAVGLAAFGDSGSGIMHDGRALGVVVAIGFSTSPFGDFFITRLPPQIAGARRALGTTLTLLTAPRR